VCWAREPLPRWKLPQNKKRPWGNSFEVQREASELEKNQAADYNRRSKKDFKNMSKRKNLKGPERTSHYQ